MGFFKRVIKEELEPIPQPPNSYMNDREFIQESLRERERLVDEVSDEYLCFLKLARNILKKHKDEIVVKDKDVLELAFHIIEQFPNLFR